MRKAVFIIFFDFLKKKRKGKRISKQTIQHEAWFGYHLLGNETKVGELLSEKMIRMLGH